MIFYKYEGHEIRQLHVSLCSNSPQRNYNDIQSLFLKYNSVILKFNSHVFIYYYLQKWGLWRKNHIFTFFSFSGITL